MSDRDTLAIIAEEFGYAFAPLKNAFETPQDTISFLKELGYDVTLNGSLSDISAIVTQIIAIVESGEIDFDNVKSLLEKIKALIDKINNLKNNAQSIFGTLPATMTELKDDLPVQIVQYLLAEYLLQNQPKVGTLLQLFGIIQLRLIPANPPIRSAYIRREIHFERIPQLFTDPLKTLKDLYGWGTPTLDRNIIFEKLTDLFEAYNINFTSVTIPDDVLTKINGFPPTDTTDKRSLRLLILDEQFSNLTLGAGIDLYINPPNGATLPGLSMLPYANQAFKEEIRISDKLAFLF
ncbi:MAG: hypothetical protein ACXWV4_07305, partial [Flavitalea sp.]